MIMMGVCLCLVCLVVSVLVVCGVRVVWWVRGCLLSEVMMWWWMFWMLMVGLGR